MVEVTKFVTLPVHVPIGGGVRGKEVSPIAGRMTQIMPHYPPGCNALVDIAFGHSSAWLLPSMVNTYMALDAATPVFNISEPIKKSEEMWIIVRNRDGANPHDVSVTVTIIGQE